MKTKNVYGVQMTGIEEMKFSKYRDNNSISMNTLIKEERFEIAKVWLDGIKETT